MVDGDGDAIRGYMLRALREAHGLSLLDAATVAGCSVVRLSNLERAYAEASEDEWKRVVGAIEVAGKTRAMGARKTSSR